MKKVMIGLLVVGFLVGASFAQAQEKKIAFSVNLGVQTNLWKGSTFEEAQGTLDVRAGIRLGKSFEISPEIMYATFYKFHFDAGFLYPGVMLNYAPGNFFVGAGAVLPVVIGGDEISSGNPAPKINIGYTTGHLVLTAYFIAWTESEINFLDMNFVGATIGYRF
jgi:hypothetical protein